MSPPITRTRDWLDRQYSMIIDVRSESEFLDDHIPGAVSMPVLNDRERAEIGTIYKQVGAFEAKRRGATLVARNIAAHIESQLLDAPRDFSPLVYCWRGGMRSSSVRRRASRPLGPACGARSARARASKEGPAPARMPAGASARACARASARTLRSKRRRGRDAAVPRAIARERAASGVAARRGEHRRRMRAARALAVGDATARADGAG